MIKEDKVGVREDEDKKGRLARSAGVQQLDRKFGMEEGRSNTDEPPSPSSVIVVFANEQEVLEGPIKVENT